MSKNLASGFDRLAPVYDSLACLVIGKGIRKSQLHFLSHLTEKRKLLMLGGGTGWILPSIIQVNPNLRIDYIDVSPSMMERAKCRIKDAPIRFIIGSEENIPDKDYDCVITNFYLDLFEDTTLEHVIHQIKNSLLPNSIWIATDFVNEKRWHKIALTIMYLFFRITTRLQTKKLPLWEQQLLRSGGAHHKEEKYCRGFIKTSVFWV